MLFLLRKAMDCMNGMDSNLYREMFLWRTGMEATTYKSECHLNLRWFTRVQCYLVFHKPIGALVHMFFWDTHVKTCHPLIKTQSFVYGFIIFFGSFLITCNLCWMVIFNYHLWPRVESLVTYVGWMFIIPLLSGFIDPCLINSLPLCSDGNPSNCKC